MTTQAEKAVKQFSQTDMIPQLGQRIMHAMGPGDVHIFPDGSIGIHWTDGAFTVGELQEDDD